MLQLWWKTLMATPQCAMAHWASFRNGFKPVLRLGVPEVSSSATQRIKGTRDDAAKDLCLDAGFVGYPVSKIARKHGYYLRVKSRAEERLIKYRYADSKPRRWVVERTHFWLNRFRKLLVSFEKTETSYVALLQLAAVLICWKHTIVICG